MTPNQSDLRDRSWLSPIIHLSSNWVSLTGVVIVTTATVFWLFLLPVTLRGTTDSPYVGILAFLVLPAPFFAGLILIPLGSGSSASARGGPASIRPNSRRSRGTTRICAAWSISCSSLPWSTWRLPARSVTAR